MAGANEVFLLSRWGIWGSRVCSSGSGRTGGLIASANCANTWASMESVLASWPVACAKLRTWRGLINDTGSPANSSSPASSVSNPPVASSTTPDGSRGNSLSTIEAMPSGSLEYCLASSVGSIATSSCLAETSIPTYTCAASGITTPPLWYFICSLLRPSLATFALSSVEGLGHTTVRALGSSGTWRSCWGTVHNDQDPDDLPRPTTKIQDPSAAASRVTCKGKAGPRCTDLAKVVTGLRRPSGPVNPLCYTPRT